MLSAFAGQRKPWLGLAFAANLGGKIFAERGAVFEAVTGTAASDPDIWPLGMAIDEEIAVGSIFVLAYPGFDDGCVFESRETAGEKIACGLCAFLRRDARLGVRVDGFAMGIAREFQAAAFDIRHAIEFVFLEKPGGQTGRGETRIARRSAEEKNLLTGREDAACEKFWKNLAEPGAASENELCGGDGFVLRSGDVIEFGYRLWRDDMGELELRAVLCDIVDNGGYRPASEQYAALRFEKSTGDIFKIDLRIARIELRGIESFMGDFVASENGRGLAQVSVVFAGEPQDTGLFK